MQRNLLLVCLLLAVVGSTSVIAQNEGGFITDKVYKGINIYDEFGVGLELYTSIPQQVDDAVRANDMATLYALSLSMSDLEDISGVTSELISSDELFDLAHLMLTDEGNVEFVSDEILNIATVTAEKLDREEAAGYGEMTASKNASCYCWDSFYGVWRYHGYTVYWNWGYERCEYGYAGCTWYTYYY